MAVAPNYTAQATFLASHFFLLFLLSLSLQSFSLYFTFTLAIALRSSLSLSLSGCPSLSLFVCVIHFPLTSVLASVCFCLSAFSASALTLLFDYILLFSLSLSLSLSFSLSSSFSEPRFVNMSIMGLLCSAGVASAIIFYAQPSIGGALFLWHPTLMAVAILGQHSERTRDGAVEIDMKETLHRPMTGHVRKERLELVRSVVTVKPQKQ